MIAQRFTAVLSLFFMSVLFAYITFAQSSNATDAYFVLTSKATSVKKGDTVDVILALMNPSKQNITSFETWMTYDPTKVKGISVDFGAQQDFDLNLIKADPFFPNEKVVKLSKVATNPTSGKTEMILATLKFQVLVEGTSADSISFSFYKDSDGSYGKNSANVVVEDVVTSIVDEAKLKDLVIPMQQNVGGANGTTNTNTIGSSNIQQSNVNTALVQNTNTAVIEQKKPLNSNTAPVVAPQNTGTGFAELSMSSNIVANSNSNRSTILSTPAVSTAPTGVSFRSSNNSIEITWNKNTSKSFMKVFYSQDKDNFQRYKEVRHDTGKYVFQNLKSNTPYYFILQEVSTEGMLGELSKEYMVKTSDTVSGESLKSATDVLELTASDAAKQSLLKVPKHAASGPEHILYFIGIMSVLGGYLFHKKAI